MAEAPVTFLLEKVEQILNYYVDLIGGAKKELEELKDELGLLKGFLEDAGRKQHKDATFRELERQIRRVVYEAEDTIDSCVTHEAAAAADAVKAKGKGKKYLELLKLKRAKQAIHIPKRISLAEEVKSIREKVKPKIDVVKMHIANGSGKNVEPPSTSVKKVQLIRQDNIVGFEDEEKELIGFLMEKTSKLDVISIFGMPGLGKTTLAWKIFQNPDIKFGFTHRIWVYVSQDSNRREVLLNILKVFTPNVSSSISDSLLVESVRDHLENAKFLLVMDDVWTVDDWNAISCVLPKNNVMGKVLVTSRHEDVSRSASNPRDPHKLRFLTEDESWQLLQLEVFGKLDGCPKDLEQMGQYIAKQCDRLPLALVVIGGILLDIYKTTQTMESILDAWKDVSENVATYLSKNKKHPISDIVELSYNSLSDDLRDCFVYLGVFPEDYRIPVWRLTRLWIAEGFIKPNKGKSLEETALENLKDLIDRNLVMVGETTPNGELKTCQVHDVIREFCISKGALEEQNVIQEIKKPSRKGVFEPQLSDIHNYRRLCIHSHIQEFLRDLSSGGIKGGHVRSFLCFCKENSFVLDPTYVSTIPAAFELLRVLDSKSFKFDQFPIDLTKLIHLRYITLSWDLMDVLPQHISKLWNLQTLVIDTQSPTLRMEADIWKMIQLRHLKTKAAIILAFKAEGASNAAGENLQTLSRLSPKYCTEDVFKRARNLNRLGIRGCLASDFDAKFLEKLHCLENLKIVNDVLYGSTSENPMPGLPPPQCFPRNLRRLTLSATYLGWMHMRTLGMIETLQVLKLKNDAFTGQTWHVDGGFTNLQFLLIDSIDLVFWEASDHHFPSLNFLVLKNCHKLHEIPSGLAKSLQMLDIAREIPESAVKSARKIEQLKERKMQGQEKPRWGGFKLNIGPGCEKQAPIH